MHRKQYEIKSRKKIAINKWQQNENIKIQYLRNVAANDEKSLKLTV